MRTSEFIFDLPVDLIAQTPAHQRDQSRLMALDRTCNSLSHHRFHELLEFIRPGDVLVFNNSKVINARLRGQNQRTGGRFELLLLEENEPNNWWAMAKPGKRASIGTEIAVLEPTGNATGIKATVTDVNPEGHRRVVFQGTPNILNDLDRLGEIPLPPYIKREMPDQLRTDNERYQTVYAQDKGSLAAPTAGLHFTRELISKIQEKNAIVAEVTLHVGLGTFAPVKAERLEEHVMHDERFVISESAATAVNTARRDKRRVIAIGTTSLRVLESVGRLNDGSLRAGRGRTNIFIHPPSSFAIVDALLTNFHLPQSTLLMLVSAFAAPGETKGREIILNAYAEAVRERYRFFSYGDAMLIL